MNKKPSFATTKEKRLLEAQQELEQETATETGKNLAKKTIQTTLVIEADLHYAIQEIGLKRKRAGIKPHTLTGIIKDALKEIVMKENK
jgi:hypothetical protein